MISNIKSEGARQLGAIAERGTIAAVGAKVGVDEAAVRHWLTGRRTPNEGARVRIAEAYGIPSDSWTVPPTSLPPTAPIKAPRQPTLPPRGEASLAAPGLTHRSRLAAIVARLEDEIAGCGVDVPINHKATMYAQLQAAVGRLAKNRRRGRALGEPECPLPSLARDRDGPTGHPQKASRGGRGAHERPFDHHGGHMKKPVAPGRPRAPLLADVVRGLAERVAFEDHGSRWPSPRWAPDPVGFARTILGVDLWKFQIEFLEAIRDNRHVAVAGGRKIGKDFVAGVAALWWYCSFPNGRVFLLAPTAKQLDEILFREIRQLVVGSGRCLECKRSAPDGPRPCPHSAVIAGRMGLQARTGLKADDFRQIIGATAMGEGGLRGFSGGRILALEDEASDIRDELDTALVGNLAGADCHRVLMSNPSRTIGFFHRAFHEERHLYATIQTSTESNPNIVQNREVFPGLATRDWIREREVAWGRGSAAWAANVDGQFPTSEAGQLFGLEMVTAASARWATTPGEGRLAIGVDVAGESESGDESAFAVRRGRRVLDLLASRALSPDAVLERILGLLERHHETASGEIPLVIIDRDGATGARVFDTINAYRRNHEGLFKLVGFRGSPPHPNPRVADSYRCMRDVLFAGLCDWIREGGAIPADLRLEGEMLALRWGEPDARDERMIRKSDLRDRLGRSPDRLDAVALSTWLGARGSEVRVQHDETPPARPIDPYDQNNAWWSEVESEAEAWPWGEQ